MITAWRIFTASWKHFARNAWLAVATIFVFMMALLSVNVLLGVNVVMDRVVTVLEDKVDITVTFKPETPEQVLTQARFYLTTLDQVRTVQLIPADEVLAQFRKRHERDNKVLAALSEIDRNPLGAQIVVKAKSPDDYNFLLQAIQSPQYQTYIQSQTYDDHKAAMTKIREVGEQVRFAGALLVAIFALFGLLTAFNAIRVAIYTHREEIAIMRLVGASSFYIRAPFVLEGVWISLFAFAMAASLYGVALVWAEPVLRPLFDGADPGIIAFFLDHALLIGGLELGAMLFLVVVVSWVAVGRYLRR